ncbi:hypothetical protein [Sporosarcina koreensis]|uniref:hypothetical protein n=1 Tax=Sporosarcina koreensis TaxID=334735 RepID=UPI00075F58AB|nr:hypothetical protein [Sporosarcina koreensis]
MSISDVIQFVLAVIAAVGAIFAFLNIRTSNRQIELQQSQWEHKHQPVFKIIYTTQREKSKVLVIENTNKVFHRIEDVSFTSSDVNVESQFNGMITNKKTRNNEVIEKHEYSGLIVTLTPIKDDFQSGFLQIRGFDALGNQFISNTVDLKFKNKELVNHIDIPMTYLKNI